MEKLFVYGTLGPGRPNAHVLQKIGGTWKAGFIWGKLFKEGWGAQMGFPGIRLADKVEIINGFVFYSDNLDQHWPELDEFEGDAYLRIKTMITLEDTKDTVEAYIYTLK